MGTKLIIDTDIGTDIDDALAIVFALASPELDLEGLTIVDGDVEARAKMASRLLGMAGRPDIPVVRGDGQPIAAGRMPTWMGHEGKGILDLDWQGPEAPILDGHAADWLVERSRVAPFRLAAIGPFTNVARAVERDPGFAGRIEGLTVMGGMAHAETYIEGWQQFFAETGIDPAHMDHNTASDLDAALRMAQAGFNLDWVTAELTFCTTLHRDAIGAFRDTGSALGACLATMLDIWDRERFHFIPGFPDNPNPAPADAAAALHDPLAIASIFGWPGLTMRPHHLTFSKDATLFHMNEVATGGEAVNNVSVAVDHAAFERFFVDRVTGFLRGLPS
ncbi:MAG: nucleoside hydrolase [Pseudomonadota bacterium]